MDFIATLPGWVIAGAICGLFGAVAALIGGALQKRGLKWGRYLPIIVIAAAVPATGGLVNWVRGATLNQEAAARMLVSTSPEFYGFIRDNFPADFDALTAEITGILKTGGTSAQVSGRAAEAVAQLRRKYSPMVAQSSDADHAAIIDSLIAFYSALQARGTELCNTVAINGPMVLIGRPDTLELAQMIEPQATVSMRAAKSGMDTPVQRRPATDQDWAEISNAMLARGATEAQLNAITTLDPASPDLCPGLLTMMQTLNEEDSEGVKAVRAEYVADLTAG